MASCKSLLYRNPDLKTQDFYASYIATYLERDVRLSLRVGSLRDFERFLRACALRSGQLLNLTDLARDIGIAGTTARDWLSVLEASNQLILLEPYFGNVTKRLIKTPKLYLRDTGLLCFLLGLDSPAALERSPFIGGVWETFVLNQLTRAKIAKGSSAQIFFWRDAHGVEVDFIIEHQGALRLIEAKWTETIADERTITHCSRWLASWATALQRNIGWCVALRTRITYPRTPRSPCSTDMRSTTGCRHCPRQIDHCPAVWSFGSEDPIS